MNISHSKGILFFSLPENLYHFEDALYVLIGVGFGREWSYGSLSHDRQVFSPYGESLLKWYVNLIRELLL